ncbi:MAG: 23S rRNA (uracil(1939)-C(5))-methyltransferase RlmD [Desulfatibacillaceae bacterium]
MTVAVKKGRELELEIEKSVFGGQGLCRVEGMAVFVDGAVPGDRVLARVYKKKKTWAMARTLEVLRPSPDRVEPPCPYAGYCGGCKWQHLEYSRQLEYKRLHVVESLAHIGQVRDVVVHETLPSDKAYGYRNKMEFSCSDRRWLLPGELGVEGVDKAFALGLHVPGTFDKVLDTSACLLMPDKGNEIMADVRAFMLESGLPAYGLKSHEGFWRFLVLRHSVARDQWMVNIVTSEDRCDDLMPLARLLREKHGVVSVVCNVSGKKAAVAVGDFEKVLAGEAAIRDSIGRFEFAISANSFFQTNTSQAERLYRTVSEYAGLTGAERVLDLYTGTGSIAIWLAENASEVMGIEINEGAIEDAWKNAADNNIANCRFMAGDVRAMLRENPVTADVVVCDPPRSGMHPRAVTRVLEIGAPRVVYVSCNPTTMSRDLALLAEMYDVAEVQPVDMFPHTYHVEAVARLVKT